MFTKVFTNDIFVNVVLSIKLIIIWVTSKYNNNYYRKINNDNKLIYTLTTNHSQP